VNFLFTPESHRGSSPTSQVTPAAIPVPEVALLVGVGAAVVVPGAEVPVGVGAAVVVAVVAVPFGVAALLLS